MSSAGLARDLAARLPHGTVSAADADRLAASADLWPRHVLGLWRGETPSLPAAVVWPGSVEEVQATLAFARERGVAVVPYGAGSSVVGGASPGAGAVVLDLKRMRRLIEIDREAHTATAEAGIVGELFERALERAGFTQGHFPSSIYCSTLGGWIAARGAGQMSSRYGKIEDQVLGGTVVHGDGSVLRQAPTPVRSPALDALVGAEGTLGVWTEATVRVHRLPEARAFRGFELADLPRALALAEAWLRAGLTPAVLRIYDPTDTLLHRLTSGHDGPHDRGPSREAWLASRWPRAVGSLIDALGRRCRCVVVLQGSSEVLRRDVALLCELAAGQGASDLGPGPGEAWWRTRYRVSYRQSNAFRAGIAVDTMEVACTWDRVLPVYERVRRAARGAGAQVLAHFSHVYLEGASIYFTYSFPAALGPGGYDRLWSRCLDAALAAGGNVSHHHGIGRLKGRALGQVLGGAVALVAEQRVALDPQGVLNPGVLDTGPQGAGVAPRETPARRDEAPVGGLLATAEPGERLARVEARLASSGLTLGPVARLFPDLSMLELARRGLAWRKGTQLRVLEPLLMGADGRVRGVRFGYVPAPRAAMGSELVPALLDGEDGEIDRLWLRCLPVFAVRAYVEAAPLAVMSLAREVARDEDLGGMQVSVRVAGERGLVRFDLPPGPLAADRLAALTHRHGARGGPPTDDELEPLRPLGSKVLRLAGPWSAWWRLLGELASHGLGLTVHLVDGAGAAGFVTAAGGGDLGDEARGAATALARAVGLGDQESRVRAAVALPLTVEAVASSALGARSQEGARAASVTGAGSQEGTRAASATGAGSQEGTRAASVTGPPRESEPDGDGWQGRRVPLARLRVAAHVHELDNCTYCPKLCRFACPVAVADGSETLTPRQLALTVALERRGARTLGVDATARLWACADCRGCRSFCDHDNDVATLLGDARAELFAAGRAPEPVVAALATLASSGRHPASPAAPVLLRGDVASSPTWLFLGCQNGSEDAAAVAGALALTQAHLGAVHVPSLERPCCGQPLWRWGDRAGFAAHARAFAAQVRGARRLVVDDPGCAYTLRTLYPAVGVSVPEVVTTSALLGRDDVVVPEGAVPHDDEWATRWLGEPPLRRRLAGPFVAGSVLEGEAGSCGGHLLALYDATLADRVARDCVADLLGGGARVVVTASPTCRRRLRAAGAPVVDVLELWSQRMARSPRVGNT